MDIMRENWCLIQKEKHIYNNCIDKRIFNLFYIMCNVINGVISKIIILSNDRINNHYFLIIFDWILNAQAVIIVIIYFDLFL